MGRLNGMGWKKDRIDRKLFKFGHISNILKYNSFYNNGITEQESVVQNYTFFPSRNHLRPILSFLKIDNYLIL